MKTSRKKILPTPKIVSLIILVMIGMILIRLFNDKQKDNTNVENTITPAFSWDNIIIITETPIPTPTKKPTPTPTITPTPIPVGALEDLFTKYSREQSVDRELLKRIALCESGLNPNASYGTYGGLFQFSESSWIVTRQSMNLSINPSLRFNPEEAIKTAAFKLAIGGRNAWPNCGK